MSATTTVTTPPKPKMTALQRAMLVHELKGEFVSPKTKTEVVKEDVPDVPGAYVLKNVRIEEKSIQGLSDDRFLELFWAFQLFAFCHFPSLSNLDLLLKGSHC